MRLVLDTNVVLDLLLFADPSVRPIAAACSSGWACCLADAATLDEWQRVVGYKDFGLAPAQVRALGTRYREQVLLVGPPTEPLPPLPRCRDRDDQKFLELAARAGADLLVTKDKALLRLKGRQGLGFSIADPVAAGTLLTSTPR